MEYVILINRSVAYTAAAAARLAAMVPAGPRAYSAPEDVDGASSFRASYAFLSSVVAAALHIPEVRACLERSFGRGRCTFGAERVSRLAELCANGVESWTPAQRGAAFIAMHEYCEASDG